MQLFYNAHINPDQKQITFEKEESRHIVRVLRKKENDLLFLTDGVGNLYKASLTIPSDKKSVAVVKEVTYQQKNRDYNLHIAIAPTKSNDRLEWFLEKATEIGIDEITPIICQNSERKVIKHERLEKILQSAMKQSLQTHLPILHPSISFSDFIIKNVDAIKCIPHCAVGEKKTLKDIVRPKANTLILIGPEGDFSSQEIQNALENNYLPVSLGPNRLRTETAALYATGHLAYINQ